MISKMPFEIREIALSDKPAALLQASPKATVPVLVLSGADSTQVAQVIDESLGIMLWALGCNDPEGWLAAADDDLIAANDGTFKTHLDHYKYGRRDDAAPLAHRAAALQILRGYEARLATSTNLCRAIRGLTDMAILPFVRQFAAVDRPWFDAQPLPGVQHWLARHLASPLFVAAMVKRQRWQPQ